MSPVNDRRKRVLAVKSANGSPLQLAVIGEVSVPWPMQSVVTPAKAFRVARLNRSIREFSQWQTVQLTSDFISLEQFNHANECEPVQWLSETDEQYINRLYREVTQF